MTSVFLLPMSLWSQLICIGDACSCDKEIDAPPNLSIAKPVRVQGVLLDDLGAVFAFENTIVQVRNPKTKTILISVSVDAKGQFDLGIVPAGEYRLIAARKKMDGNLVRQPLMDQPKAMSCSSDSPCWIQAIQHQHGTDLPFEFCPPK
jgi:hypothetical protein